MTSPPPPPPLKQRRKPSVFAAAMFTILFLALMAFIIMGTFKATTWAMQASGWNCAWRKWGEAQGWKNDVPAEQSTYCKGHQ